MCVPCCIYSDGEIHTSVLLFSGKFSFAFLPPPLPFFQPLSTFPQIMARFQPHRTPEGGQQRRSVCWRHQGLPGWGSCCSSGARPAGCPCQGSHHGTLGMSTEPMCRSLRGSVFHLLADLERECGEVVFVWILVNLIVFQVVFFLR